MSREAPAINKAEPSSRITCVVCNASLHAKVFNGTEVILIVAEREGWLGLTSGWYCPCCRSPTCTH